MESKPFYASKTFWVNIFAGIALVVQTTTGKVIIDMEVQATALALVNIILRFATKGKVTLS